MKEYLLLHSEAFPAWLSKDVVYTWAVMVIVLGLSWLATRKMAEVPRGIQNVFETVIELLQGAVRSSMGARGDYFLPLIAGFAFYIFTSNIVGLLPGFHPPTAGLNTTASLAIIVFVLTHYYGVKTQGAWNYIKHFAGPIPAMAPLMFPIEIVGHLTRPVSLSLRLFGNMMGKEKVLLVLLMLVPFFIPMIIMGLGVLVAVIQTVVFCLLAMIYIGSAMEDAHH
ncbi:ATP synthase F0, A subunit [Desulfurispirillum indicum S5]|uniref:ATP synthase subunit a n=1 Tax=Desulfurispirillum indicum (strain ATCC BAA-1389 / DSM 22839 / S5) TaxID=653733 RepID=E6W1W8_DESIS|nr:F0F1 ATP synthase subunit A [Desulfurispirillum indicum]ADU65500.1 ATP synthase F0, A subunit [Desulfurispirillum indicum S5]